MASDFHRSEPRRVLRRVKGQKEIISVQQPSMIATYNAHMGSVDVLDGYLANLRSSIGGKKWYWMPMINILRLLQVAAYRFYVALGHSSVSQIDFLQELVHEAVRGFSLKSITRTGSHRIVASLSISEQHMPIPVVKQGRCRVCKKNCRSMCSICGLLAHEKFWCFYKLHSL